MKFIREMIARKAAGDDYHDEDQSEDVAQDTAAGFEDELEAEAPVVAEGYDEDAELEALDAALPKLEQDEGNIEQLFPDEAAHADLPEDELFADIPDPDTNEPMPELTAEDVERAMQNRKRFWQNLPEDTDPLAIPDEGAEAVTRKIGSSPMFEQRPADVPFELVDPAEDEIAEDEAPAEVAVEDVAEEMAAEAQPEAAEMEMPEVEAEAPTIEAAPEAEVAEATPPQADQIADKLAAAMSAAPVNMAAEPEEMPEEPMATAPVEEAPVAQAPVAEESAEVTPVFEEVEDQAPWPQSAPEAAPEPAAQSEDAFDGPDIQALMAKAALEAAGTSAEEVAAEKPARRAGRVKTRLLGFQPDAPGKDIFDTAGAAKSSEPDMFPVGWMVVVKGPGRGASFSLHNGVSLIGRGEDQAICLDFGDNSISRNNHASVAFDEETGEFFLGHGGKSNIVRLNKKPVLSTESLSNGDEIRLGETTLKFAAFCSEEFSWNEDGAAGMDDAANQ